jgi:3-hydroxyacyl-[acyl-carrier protein] dehydratase / trans-2-decenoyl-[acyl-carrier protein] isomerase
MDRLIFSNRNRCPIEQEGHVALADPYAFHSPQSSYTKEELLESGRGGYFGPGNAQLPAPPMLMMDRITEISLDGGEFGKGHIVGELDITPDLWFFDCHFVADPVMPGCLGLDAMWQMVGYWLGWSGSPGKGRAVGVGEVKFSGHITPDIKCVRYNVEMHKVRRGKLVLGIANGRVFADHRCVYVANDLRVGLVGTAA